MAGITVKLLRGFEQAPPNLEVLAKLCTALNDPYVETGEIAGLIRIDPSLAASVLRLSNSAFFGTSSPSSSIDEAVHRIGVAEVVKLVALAGRRSFMGNPLRCYGLSSDDAWRLSLAVAILMEQLACQTGIEDDAKAYLIGLLHGIGRYPIARLMSRVKPTIFAPENPLPGQLARWEREQVGCDYAKMGALLLKSWDFGSEISEPIAGHLHPFLAHRSKRIACLLHVCCVIAPSVIVPSRNLFEHLLVPQGILRSANLNEEVLLEAIEPASALLRATETVLQQEELLSA